MNGQRIYLDGAANAPIHPEVAKAMAPYLSPDFCGNSHSAHWFGGIADQAVTASRNAVAWALGARAEDVYFTSGATESNNWVIKGLALKELSIPEGERRLRVVCPAIEHASVLNSCESLSALGFDVRLVPCLPDGRVDLAAAAKEIVPGGTLLVCCMAVNNETGAAQPVRQMAEMAREAGAASLCDVTQALGLGGSTLALDKLYGADFYSLSAHKIGGPMGAGALVSGKGAVPPPFISGGAQERGLRGGTSNVAGAVGLAKAIEILREKNSETEASFYRTFIKRLLSELGPAYKANVTPDDPMILSLDCSGAIDYPGPLAEALDSKGVAVSAGAACSESDDDGTAPSHVLMAMGLTHRSILATIRVSMTTRTTADDIDGLAAALKEMEEECPAKPAKGRKK